MSESENNGSNLPAVIQSYAVMVTSRDEIAEVITENIGGSGMSRLDLPTVRIPTGGGANWTIPDLEGEKSEKILRGVIAYQTVARGFWEALFDTAGGAPPTCYSNDGKTGVGTPGGDCATCKLNTWGSDRRGGQGKACRELRLLFILQEESLLPMVVVLPPTSVKPAHQYLVGLAAKGAPYYGVVTEISPSGLKHSPSRRRHGLSALAVTSAGESHHTVRQATMDGRRPMGGPSSWFNRLFEHEKRDGNLLDSTAAVQRAGTLPAPETATRQVSNDASASTLMKMRGTATDVERDDAGPSDDLHVSSVDLA